MDHEAMEQVNSDVSSDSSLDDSSNSSSDGEAECEDAIAEESEMPDALKKEVDDLESNLSSNPYLYDAHVKLIEVYRKFGHWEKLAQSRQRMREHYPLSPPLWLSWLKDVQKHDKAKEDKEAITSLFKAACVDYQSVDVWLEYCTFAIGCMADRGQEWVRTVFEEALSHVGGNVSRGADVWAAYRDFEMICLAQLSKTEGDDSAQEKVDRQMEVVSKLFKRQLSLPLRDMEATMLEFREWSSSIPKEVQAGFERAKNALKEVEPLVEAIEDAENDEDRVKGHVALIDFLERKGIPSRIIAAYEDALTAVCLRADLWLRYLNYLSKNFLTADTILPQCRRGVRNCPWSLELWLLEAEMLEHFHKDEEVIRKTYEDALQAGFTESGAFLRLWTAYVSFLRRRVDWSLPLDSLKAAKEVEELRDTFERAIIQLEKYFNLFGDPTCSLFRFWAFIEAKYLSNLPKARELWSEVMKRKHGNEAHMWLEYISFERAYGDPKHCRKVLARAVNSVTDWPEHVFEACLRFEREEGSLESFLDLRTKVEQQRARLDERAQATSAKEATVGGKKSATETRTERRGKKRTGGSQNTAPEFGPVGPSLPAKRPKGGYEELSKSSVPPKEPVGPAAPAKEAATAPTKDSEGFVVPSAPRPGPAAAKSAPPPGGLPPKAAVEEKMDTADIIAAAEKAEEKTKEEKHGVHVEHDPAKDHITVFISNLNFNTKEPAVRSVFEKVGEIKEIRIVNDHRGRSKGFGYVEFTSEGAAKAALRCDRSEIEGRPMFVSECNPNKRYGFQFAAGLEKNKLFVRNLPRTITKHALETLFGQHGRLRSVRVATYRNGSPKGHAYIEFASENDASRALVATDNLRIGENSISVALSNPPPRREGAPFGANTVAAAPIDPATSLGCGRRETADHGRARTQVSLVPRALQRKPPGSKPPNASLGKAPGGEANGAGAGEAAKPKSGGLSNEEFRKLFLKK